jgi:hypothetical protein
MNVHIKLECLSMAGLSSLPFQVLHSRVGSGPYPQTLDYAGKVCQGQNILVYYEHLKITTVKSFITLDPGRSVIKRFTFRRNKLEWLTLSNTFNLLLSGEIS